VAEDLNTIAKEITLAVIAKISGFPLDEELTGAKLAENIGDRAGTIFKAVLKKVVEAVKEDAKEEGGAKVAYL